MKNTSNEEETLSLWDVPESNRYSQKKKGEIILENLETHKRFNCSTSSTVILGRDKMRCDVQLSETDLYMSGVHMKLIVNDERIYAEDLDSKNGTFLNSIKLRKREEMRVGDILRLGHSEFRLLRFN